MTPSACNATTCPGGCCDDNDVCQPGNAGDACGNGGGRCASCAGGDCTAGRCAFDCNATTCAGCCDAQGDCLLDQTADACGRNGDACVACIDGFACTNGVCGDASCLATCAGCCDAQGTCNETSLFDSQRCGEQGEVCQACGPATICENGVCIADSLSRWNLMLLSGTVAPTTPGGEAWDAFGGYPDPMLCFRDQASGTVRDCSLAADNTTTPVWNLAMLMNRPPQDLATSFWVMLDEDSVIDDEIGACPAPTLDDKFDGNVYTFTCTNKFTVRFKIIPTP